MSEFDIGDIVEHVLTKDWMIVVKIKDGLFVCRTKDYQLIEFHPFELKRR